MARRFKTTRKNEVKMKSKFRPLKKDSKGSWYAIIALLFLLVIVIIIAIGVMTYTFPAEVDFSFIRQDDQRQADIVARETFKLNKLQNAVQFKYHKITSDNSRNEFLLDSLYPCTDFNIVTKYEYYREDFRRNRVGIGIASELGIFFMKQYFTKEDIHNGDNHNLVDTSLGVNWEIDRLRLAYQFSFLTNCNDIDYKYIKVVVKNTLTKNLSLVWVLDRRWEEVRRDLTKLSISLKI
jgi:hypothetical protein